MVYTAVGSLHFHHPFKFVSCFIEDIGSAVAALGDTDIVIVEVWCSVVGVYKIRHSLCCRHHISSVISRIVPAATDVYLFVCAVYRSKGGMAGSVAEVLVLYLCAAALKIEHPHAVVY